jgi:hypothetical protein
MHTKISLVQAVLTLSLLFSGFFSSAISAAGVEAPPAVLQLNDSTIIIYVTSNEFKLSQKALVNWIDKCAKGIRNYFGLFPVKKLNVFIYPSQGSGITYAEARPENGATIKVYLGVDSTERDLRRAWMLIHEMVHLGFTFTDDAQDWATEGLATYSEPIIRAQMGDQTNEEAWSDMKGGLAQGLPIPNDRGLDHTRTWGRVYWGGALFYLLADIQLRTQTEYKKGLPDALKSIVQRGGNIETNLTLTEVFKKADEGTGTKVLSNLYNQMAATPVGADLDALWKQLGVNGNGEQVTLAKHAALVRAREAIEKGRAD